MENRYKKIVRASNIGIFLNFGLAVLKTAVGVMAGSVSVIADAINNSMDMLSSGVALIGAKLAKRKPDKEHPFGHGRIEYVAAIGIGAIIMMVGVGVILRSVPEILRPRPVNYSVGGVIVIFLTIIAKVWYSRYLKSVGKQTRSRSLLAAGVDAMFDAMLSVGTIVGALINMLVGASIDGWIGLLIAAFIMKNAGEVIMEGVRDVIGRKVDSGLVRKVRETIRGTDGVVAVKELTLHDYGPEKIVGAARVEVRRGMSMREFNEVCEKIREELLEQFGIEITIGV